MKYTHIIWDFNGTILDDMEIGIKSVNKMLSFRGLPIIESLDQYRKVFCFPIIKYYGALGFDFDKEDYYTVLAPEWVANYTELVPTARAFDGVSDTIESISAMGLEQVLLSASEQQQLVCQLKQLGLDRYFSDIIGLDNMHAKSKEENARRWRQKNPQAQPLFIGDTEHDAEVAAAVSADCVLFAGGHQSEERLAGLGSPVIRDIRELIEYL